MKSWLSWVKFGSNHKGAYSGGGGGFPIKRLSMFYWKPNHLQI